MSRFISKTSFGIVLLTVACGQAARPAQAPAPSNLEPSPAPVRTEQAEPAPEASAESTSKPESEPEALSMPTSCADPSAPLCTPPAAFVTELCKRGSADLALAMFKKTTPWRRAYLRLDTQAWYTGARLSAPKPLELDEEVLVVANRATSSKGVQVGGGSYDVYRWDGTCASVMADEVTFTRPREPRAASIAWEHIGDEFRDRLLSQKGVRSRRDAYKSRCHDDRQAPACTDARAALSQVITDYVRAGGDVPEPQLALR